MEFFAHVIDLIDDTTSNQDEHHAHHHAESTTTFLKCCLLCLEDTHQRPDPCTFFSSQHEIEMLEHLDTAHPHVNMLDIYDVRFFRIRKTCETLSERTKYHKPLRLVNIVAVHAYFRLLEDNKQQQQQQRTFEYIVPMIECRFCVEAGNVEVERYEPPRHGFFLNDIWTHVQEAHAFRAREYLDLCSEMDDFQIKSSTHNHHRSTKTCNTTTKRPTYLSWDEYFIGIAFLSAQRSKDPRSQVGACIVDGDQKIVGIGYNGFPRGCSDDHLPWAREGPKELDTKYPFVCHAEMNAIMNSGDVKGCVMYVALFPCNECTKLIIQSGITEVIYVCDKYHQDWKTIASKKMLDMAKITYRQHQLTRRGLKIDFHSIF